MTDEQIAQFSRRIQDLPEKDRDLASEILESYANSVREIQVKAMELEQRNKELSATREKLERERRRYRKLFEFAPDGYLVTDPSGMIIATNQAAVDLLRSTPDGLEGQRLAHYVAHGERGLIQEYLDHLTQTPIESNKVTWELHIRPQEGPLFASVLRVSPMYAEDGTLGGLYWLVHDISERERLSQEAREQRARAEQSYRLVDTIIQHAPEGIIVADQECRIIMSNKAAQDIYRQPVPIGEPLESHARLSLSYPDGTPYPVHELPLSRSALNGEEISGLEMAIIWPDGQRRSLLVNSTPIRDQNERLAGAMAIFQDITAHKRRERTLQFQAKVLDQIADAVIAIDHLDRVTYLNAAAVQRYGVDEDQALGRQLDELYDYGWLNPDEEQVAYKTLQEHGYWRGENMHVTKDGKRLVVESAVSIVTDEHGQPTGLLASMRDITAQWDAEAELQRLYSELQRHADRLEEAVDRRTSALRASEARFRAIFEGAPLGIAILDKDGRIVLSNPALQRILGCRAEQVEHQVLFKAIEDPNKADEGQSLFTQLWNGAYEFFQLEVPLRHQDERSIQGILVVSRIQGMGVSPPLAIALIEDITEQRTAEEALIRSEKLALMGRISASLAHEINNPLQSVIGFLGLAEEMLDDDSEVRRFLQLGMDELERVAGIVTQLHNLGRESDAQKTPTDLTNILERTLMLTRKRSQNQSVQINWNPVEGLPKIPVVPDRIQQVFMNIILNAVEAMPKGGYLQVSSAATDDPPGVTVTFADTGVGIERERLPHIFEPFHTSRPDGLGMGLYVSRQIIQEHGGHIEVKSRLGEGATVTVWLPHPSAMADVQTS